ncbi:hypothetical protein EK21DRAFT_110837 [Setomelanomma holmii]|uniref:Uncharacterized protein n=1 Tax=Setomelanomma holmii TaxID=210430 RepID=A0A9P4HAN9_9PLEO|nr:hypothetical protein EK21DRAFT_110837 [Setomelanomma holmii]
MATMHKTPSETEIASTLAHLKLSTKVPQKPAHKPKSKPVADSWDEDASGSDTDTEPDLSKASTSSPHTLEPISTVTSNDLSPHPPPPTPASPTPFDYPDNVPYGASRSRGDSGVGRTVSDKRPEKTTAVAGRLIAGALGVRAPKRTDEEREYDKAMREKERRRRAEERERETREREEVEARKKAVWDD